MTSRTVRHGDHESMSPLLARYELGALTREERSAFEAHALECDRCFEALERGAVVAGAIRERAADLAAALRRDAPSAGRARAIGVRALVQPFLRMRYALPAAAAVVLAVVGVRIALGPPQSARLASFPDEEVRSTIVRGPAAGDAVWELMETGGAYFDLGRFDEAAARFRAAWERDRSFAQAAYLLGLALARSGSFDEAVAPLEAAARGADAALARKAEWVLANAHLAARRPARARAALESLARDAGGLGAMARDLLARLPR
jgi:tetratricopeptide (TPR) repeat protein